MKVANSKTNLEYLKVQISCSSPHIRNEREKNGIPCKPLFTHSKIVKRCQKSCRQLCGAHLQMQGAPNKHFFANTAFRVTQLLLWNTLSKWCCKENKKGYDIWPWLNLKGAACCESCLCKAVSLATLTNCKRSTVPTHVSLSMVKHKAQHYMVWQQSVDTGGA